MQRAGLRDVRCDRRSACTEHAPMGRSGGGNLERAMARATATDQIGGFRPMTRDECRPHPCALVVGLLAVAAVLTGCLDSGGDTDSGTTLTPAQAAEQLIAGPLAEQVGLGPLSPSCPDMTAAKGGDVFPCTAATETDRLVNVDAAILPTGQVELSTTNVILGSALPSFEQSAVDAINKVRPDANLATGAVECGDNSVVLPDDRMMICELTDPQTEQIFEVSLTVDDIEGRQFSLVVADRPKS